MVTKNSTDEDVVDITSVVDLDLDATDPDEREEYPPFRVRIGGKTFSLAPPDAGLVMELEESRTTRVFLALAFDEQWPDVNPLLAGKKPEQLITLVRQYGQHFDLDQQALLQTAAPNRAERRRRPARGRSRR